MKKTALVFCLSIMVSLASTVAGAESIKGKLGITGRLGFLVPANSEVVVQTPAAIPALVDVDTDVGLYGGGGVIYGIDDHFAADLEITHASFGTSVGGDGSITDVSLGAQYRFDQRQKVTPYVGAGLDILVNDYSHFDVDTVLGIHVRGGIDYFLQPNLALNAEAKIVVAPNADMNTAGIKQGNFDPSGITGSVGVRFFF